MKTGMKTRAVLDIRDLPEYAFGHRSIMWWGTLGFIAIEGTVFVLALTSYFYLRSKALQWPLGVPPPDLLPGIVNSVILFASLYPNQRAKRAAEDEDAAGVKFWLVVCLAFGVAFNIVRIFEFRALNCRWDTNAYGSIVWTILGLHTTHILTDVVGYRGSDRGGVPAADRRAPLCRCQREFVLLVFRGAELGPDLCGDLSRAAAVSGASDEEPGRRTDIRAQRRCFLVRHGRRAVRGCDAPGRQLCAGSDRLPPRAALAALMCSACSRWLWRWPAGRRRRAIGCGMTARWRARKCRRAAASWR